MANIGGSNVPLLPVTILVIGGYITWFAVHYWEDQNYIYPTDPVKEVLQGGKPGAPQKHQIGEAADISNAFGSTTGGSSGNPGQGNTAPTINPAGGVENQVQFTKAQLESLWTSAGGDPAYAGWAAAIAESESSGNARVTSGNPDGGTNVGLFQLDTPGGVGSGHSVSDLQNPVLNTQITIMATKNGTDWAEWGDPVTARYGYKGIKNFTG